jgi:hypothetical protein
MERENNDFSIHFLFQAIPWTPGPETGGGKPVNLRKSCGVIAAYDMHDSRSDPIAMVRSTSEKLPHLHPMPGAIRAMQPFRPQA